MVEGHSALTKYSQRSNCQGRNAGLVERSSESDRSETVG